MARSCFGEQANSRTVARTEYFLQFAVRKTNDAMKSLYCLFAALLLTVSLRAQEAKLLSYTREFDIAGMDPVKLHHDLIDSVLENSGLEREFSGEYPLGDARPDIANSTDDVILLKGTVRNLSHVGGLFESFLASYEFDYTMSIALLGDRLLFEMSRIRGCMNGYDLNEENGDWCYMTEDASTVRRGIYGSIWRKHDRLLRGHLQEFFDRATQLLYDSVTD